MHTHTHTHTQRDKRWAEKEKMQRGGEGGRGKREEGGCGAQTARESIQIYENTTQSDGGRGRKKTDRQTVSTASKAKAGQKDQRKRAALMRRGQSPSNLTFRAEGAEGQS